MRGFGRAALIAAAIIGVGTPGRADPILLGHNLDPTTEVLPAGTFMAGSYAVGYGISDHWMIATSPWMIVQYNMPMIDSKFSFPVGLGLLRQVSIEGMFFKTFPYGMNIYQQESTFDRITGTFQWDELPRYKLHLTLGFQYFFNDEAPYSLNMIPSMSVGQCTDQSCGAPTPATLSLGALHEFDLARRYGFFLETAVLGFNYENPYLHTGASIFFKGESWMAQLGASFSWSTEPVQRFYADGSVYEQDIGHYWAVHPEVQAQWEF